MGKQLNRQFKLLNQVDVAVTDSPILFSTIYHGFGCVEGFDEVVLKQFNLFRNLNIFLVRNSSEHPYNPKGRSQTEEEAVLKDSEIKDMLDRFNIDYHTMHIKKDGSHVQEILKLINSQLA